MTDQPTPRAPERQGQHAAGLHSWFLPHVERAVTWAGQAVPRALREATSGAAEQLEAATAAFFSEVGRSLARNIVASVDSRSPHQQGPEAPGPWSDR